MAILRALSLRMRAVSGAGGTGTRGGGTVSATPSTLFPHRQIAAGAATRRPHPGQTRLSVEEEDTAIYPKILT